MSLALVRYKLTTQTLPLLTNLMNWDKLFQSPFKSDVYFFSTRLQINQKWGTANPITIRDKEFGAVRLARLWNLLLQDLRSARVSHACEWHTRTVHGRANSMGSCAIRIVSSISDFFAQSAIPFLDMAANQDEFGNQLKLKLDPEFKRLGMGLDTLQVQNVSLPDELQKILDQRIGMGLIGDMTRYTQYQTAQSIPIAAANEGGGQVPEPVSALVWPSGRPWLPPWPSSTSRRQACRRRQPPTSRRYWRNCTI